MWTLAEPRGLAGGFAECIGWGVWVWIWEADIRQAARHDILFSWAALTQIQLHLLFSHGFKSCTKNSGILRAHLQGPITFNSHNLKIAFMTKDKDILSVTVLILRSKKSLTLKSLQIKRKNPHCMCMQLYLPILCEFKTCGHALACVHVCVCVCAYVWVCVWRGVCMYIAQKVKVSCLKLSLQAMKNLLLND